MSDYAKILKHDNRISICFYIEQKRILEIGEKINELNENAYMNGYNWEAFFNYYLPTYFPDVAVNMETDPEAGMYVAYYELTNENEKRVEKFLSLIENLIENENKLLDLIKNEGEFIEWD
jgi:Immunity protein 51